MTRHTAPALLLALALGAGACNQPSGTDRKLAELQKQLDDTRQQLEATKSQAAEAQQGTLATAEQIENSAQAQARRDQEAAAQVAKAQAAAQRTGTALDATQRALEDQKLATARTAQDAAALRREVEALTPREFTLPAETEIQVRTTGQVSTAMSRGATFDAVLEEDLVVDGTVLAKTGALVTCVVTSSDPGGKVKGVASLGVAVRSIAGVAGPIAVKTSTYGAQARSTKGKDARNTAIATGAGAVIGAIIGGGKGAAIGAGVGAGAGVGTAMATRGAPAVIPSETLIRFRLTAPVTVTMTPTTR